MSKRKQNKQHSDDEDSGSDVSFVDVDFEFFDPNPAVDYIALKRLLTQLFQADAELFSLHELAELILSQPLLGSTVKTDGRESDPYAFLSVINMNVHQNHPSIKALAAYALAKSASSPALHTALENLLAQTSTSHIGFVFSERLVNMPVQVIPPMYRMLSNEIQWANDENEPYNFTHYLVLTRTYRLTPEQAAQLESEDAGQRPSKKRKEKPVLPSIDVKSGISTYSFHPEDEYIQKHALHTFDYSLTNQQPREEDSFGLDIGGRLMLVEAEKFQTLVAAMSEAYATGGSSE